MTSFELTVRDAPPTGAKVVDVVGELDLTNAEDLEIQLDEIVADAGALVLELNELTFIDSAALHVLFRLARRLGRERLGIVVDPNAVIARTLTIANVPDAVTLRGSVDDALADLAL